MSTAFTPGDYCSRGRSEAGEKAGSDAKQDGWSSPSLRTAARLGPLGLRRGSLARVASEGWWAGKTRTCNQSEVVSGAKLVRSVGYASRRQQTPQRAARYVEWLGAALDLR
jgi:hypothetical protein